MSIDHVEEVTIIENKSFNSPWPKEAFISELEKNKCARYRVITISDKVVAFGGFWIAKDTAHITNIAVHPDSRGKGIGGLILEDIINCIKGLSINSITLEVRKSNIRATKLYTKYGFHEIGIRKGYYQDTGEDGIVMWKHW